ncbi:hypothetical protein AB0J90_29935 [Micromonospora sp. NPDC049523]|uniref:hypothetical protein n=1 Tax=Micromonospora sp. NPDC049523 TaxID=3155921 RepID=UPI0034390D50
MTAVHEPDPIDLLRQFVERVSPYDPDPSGVPVASIELRHRHAVERFPLTPHLVRALGAALAGYRDPGDRGRCGQCGGRRLDDNLHCVDCGRLHGVLGEVIAARAARLSSGGSATDGPVR